MSTTVNKLSEVNLTSLPDVSQRNFGIVVSEWNETITESLFSGCYNLLVQAGIDASHIKRINVPGSFELTSGARLLADDHTIDAVICLGCVIQGETRHFEFICNAVANGLTQLCIAYRKPFIFGVLTTDNLQQAIDRSGGKYGNKGVEAAQTAIKMVSLF